MMPGRATQKEIYASDILATNFVRRVDDHFVTQAAFGWTAPVGGELPIPRGLRPRHVVGVDAAGGRHSAVVGDTTSDLWTRTVTTWDILGDDGALYPVTMTGQVGEAITF